MNRLIFVVRKVALFACLLSLSACSLLQPKPLVSRPIEQLLLAPNSAPYYGYLTQSVRFRYGDIDQSLLFQTELTPSHILMIALDPLGVPLFELRWDGEKADVIERIPLDKRLDVRRILLDFQFSLWQQQDLALHFAPLGLQITTSAQKRAISSSSGEHISINSSYNSGQVPTQLSLIQHDLGYQLDIETIEADIEQPTTPILSQ